MKQITIRQFLEIHPYFFTYAKTSREERSSDSAIRGLETLSALKNKWFGYSEERIHNLCRDVIHYPSISHMFEEIFHIHISTSHTPDQEDSIIKDGTPSIDTMLTLAVEASSESLKEKIVIQKNAVLEIVKDLKNKSPKRADRLEQAARKVAVQTYREGLRRIRKRRREIESYLNDPICVPDQMPQPEDEVFFYYQENGKAHIYRDHIQETRLGLGFTEGFEVSLKDNTDKLFIHTGRGYELYLDGMRNENSSPLFFSQEGMVAHLRKAKILDSHVIAKYLSSKPYFTKLVLPLAPTLKAQTVTAPA